VNSSAFIEGPVGSNLSELLSGFPEQVVATDWNGGRNYRNKRAELKKIFTP
jgi:hypothetical protein